MPPRADRGGRKSERHGEGDDDAEILRLVLAKTSVAACTTLGHESDADVFGTGDSDDASDADCGSDICASSSGSMSNRGSPVPSEAEFFNMDDGDMDDTSEIRFTKEDGVCDEGDWRPGWATGLWINTRTPLQPQGRVLVVNAMVSASRIPHRLARAVVEFVSPGIEGCRQRGRSIVSTLVGGLLGISPSLAMQVFTAAKRGPCAFWTPCRPSVSRGGEEACPPPGASGGGELARAPREQACPPSCNAAAGGPDSAALLNLVRLAISTASEGRSWQLYVRDAMRHSLAGANMGHKYASRHFASEVAAMASMVIQQLDAFDFNMPLPGLGIPSDFAVLADPVSMGDSILARHDVLLIMCLALVSARIGTVYNPMHSGHAMPIGSHGGVAMAKLMLAVLEQHPASWGSYALCARLACVGGDGGLCLGGKDHRHQSAAAAERLWKSVHCDDAAPTCTSWDPFHRTDIAVWRAIRRHDAVMELFDVSKETDYLFGQSEGVVIFRSVATYLNENPHTIRAPGGTRKVVYLAGVPSCLVENFKLVMTGLWARLAWKQAGHSSQSIQHILHVARRMSSFRFVVVMLLTHDILLHVVRPFAKHVQKHLEPATFRKHQQSVVCNNEAARSGIRRLRVLLRVLSLCRQHLNSDELGRCAYVWGPLKNLSIFSCSCAWTLVHTLVPRMYAENPRQRRPGPRNVFGRALPMRWEGKASGSRLGQQA